MRSSLDFSLATTTFECVAEFFKHGNHVYKKKMRGRWVINAGGGWLGGTGTWPRGCFWNHSTESVSLHFLMGITEQLPQLSSPCCSFPATAWRVTKAQPVWVNMATSGNLSSSVHRELGCVPVDQGSHFCLESLHRLQPF